MGSFLSVTNGSDQPPKFIVLEYSGAGKKQKPFVLVGKGITFDSGGISLKPGLDMDQMKFDMCGAASVLGTFRGSRRAQGEGQPRRPRSRLREHAERPRNQARRRRQEHVGTDDRGPEHRCRRPTDPVRRADLCGALRAGGGGRHRHADRRNGGRAGPHRERGCSATATAWRERCSMPARNRSIAAGKCRCGTTTTKASPATSPISPTSASRAGGSITAACFLSKFAKKYDWAHLDIAGVAWKDGKEKGATGRPVPLLTTWLLSQENAGLTTPVDP